jgi:ABC-type spermidine/putrescine transport system permease subunit II
MSGPRRLLLARLLTGLVLGVLAFVILGPLVNLVLWAVAERWYFPNRLPSQFGFAFWARVFSPRGGATAALWTSVAIALATVAACALVALPAGWALARLRLPGRALVLLVFLLPQAFPNLPVYINVARMFYWWGLAGTIPGVVLVHTLHGLVFAVWITSAAFAAVDRTLEEAARNLGAGPWRTFTSVTLPLAAPGILAASIFVFLESLDEFTGTYFVGVPDVLTLPLLMFNASLGGNYQIAAITALILLVPSLLFMAVIERFLKAEVLAKVGG